MIMIPLLIMPALDDNQYDISYLNNKSTGAYKLCIYAKLCNCLLQWSNTESKKIEVCRVV